jgi:predicted Ser/Thr protein kinase
MMALSPGTRLGPYEILAPLGAGGMGEVYRARDPRLGRDVAIKVSSAQFTERFEREARAIAQLNHSRICQLYDIGPDYLVMELIEGVPLKGPLPVQKAVEYAGQILDALDAAHRRGITHRDLKPANILVTRQGIKLLDFGLAKQAGPPKGNDARLTEALTGEGQIVGTLQYMSPEQLQGKDADARSDIFAFGCVLYEMLAGTRAFQGDSSASLVGAILHTEAAPLSSIQPLTPPAVERVVRTCLAKNPDDRFQTAREVKLALEWSAAAPVESGAVTTRAARPWPWIVLAVVAVVVAVAVAGAWEYSSSRQTPIVEERAIPLSLNPPKDGQFLFGNAVGGIALSPDGRTAAFVVVRNGIRLLWVMDLDGSPARPLSGTEGAAYPFWSPDNKSVAFFSRGKLRRVEKRGSEPLAICDVAVGRGGVWMSDHRILYGSLTAGLFVVPDSTGTPSPLTTPDPSRGEIDHRWPQVLPGGRFLYWVQSGKTDTQGIYAASLAKPTEAKRLVSANVNGLYAPGGDGRGFLLWLRGGTLVAQELDLATLTLTGEIHQIADPVASVGITNQMNVAVSAGGLLLYSAVNTPSQFTWIDRAAPEKKPLEVIGEPGEYGAFRLSPDRRRVVTMRDRPGGTDICLLEVGRGVPNPFTFPPDSCGYPIWSPTRPWILFTSLATRNLYRKDSDGGGAAVRLTQSPLPQYAVDWSGDGRWVLYWAVTPGTKRDLWVLPMTPEGRPAPDAKPQLYVGTPFNESWGRFSPEPSPRWVAYQSDEPGQPEVYIDAFREPRGRKRISTAGGTYPQWGADGRELFYVSPDSQLMVVKLKPMGNSLEPSDPVRLFPLPAVDVGYSPYDTTLNGQRFLVRATPEHAVAQPLTVIVNWPALLKKDTDR